MQQLILLDYKYLLLDLYEPIINWAGGLYGRILTEVVSTDWRSVHKTEVKVLQYRPT